MAFHIQSSQSFEPRVGTAQFIFGVIYVLITLISLSLAFYVRSQGQDGYLQLFMSGLFAIMAFKSFFISRRIKNLLNNGTYCEATVESCEPVRGITVIKGTIDVPEFGIIHIESRLVGEAPAHEINRFLQDKKQTMLPALIVGANTGRPRGMFTIKCKNGHFVEDSASLKSQQTEQAANTDKTSASETASDSAGAVAGFGSGAAAAAVAAAAVVAAEVAADEAAAAPADAGEPVADTVADASEKASESSEKQEQQAVQAQDEQSAETAAAAEAASTDADNA